MTIEHALPRIVEKPWGSTDLRPWSALRHPGGAVGELCFERADAAAPAPALLLKLLFTSAPLSIQVHPDDAVAHASGLPHGKAEAWYVLSAHPAAQVAVGLTHPVSGAQLRAAIADGSVAELVHWRPAMQGDVIFVPGGTIHAVGAGLVLAEIQQRSDTTFRLFDHGRARALHVDQAVAAATAGPAARQTVPHRLTAARTLLVASPHFVLERLELPPETTWALQASVETWVLAVAGHARIGQTSAGPGDAAFLEDDCARIAVGADGLHCLLGYAATEPDPCLLHRIGGQRAGPRRRGLAPPPVPRLPGAHWPAANTPETCS